MMRSETLRDRLLQVIGLIVLAGLTAAFIFAFREHMLPQQDENDAIGIVFAMASEDEPDDEAELDPVEGLEDLLSGEEE